MRSHRKRNFISYENIAKTYINNPLMSIGELHRFYHLTLKYIDIDFNESCALKCFLYRTKSLNQKKMLFYKTDDIDLKMNGTQLKSSTCSKFLISFFCWFHF